MKKLEITKGEWKVGYVSDEDFYYVKSEKKQIADCFRSTENGGYNAELIADAGNTYQECELLPSELLKQNKELREALNQMIRNFEGTYQDCSMAQVAFNMGQQALKNSKPLVKQEFHNGHTSWYETFYEIATEIDRMRGSQNPPKMIAEIQEYQGTGGFYELAKELTDKFENLNEGREWDGEFFDEIETFIETEIGK